MTDETAAAAAQMTKMYGAEEALRLAQRDYRDVVRGGDPEIINYYRELVKALS